MRRSTDTVRALAVGGVLGVLLAGCSGGESTEPVPAPTSSSSAAPSEPATEPTASAEEQAVVDVATAYYAARDEMLTTGVLDEAGIRATAEEPFATEALVAISELIDPGARLTGAWQYDVESVTVDGDAATLVMCISPGTAVLTVDGQAVASPASAGELALARGADGWKITGTTTTGACSGGGQ